MQFSTIFAIASALTLVAAAPTPAPESSPAAATPAQLFKRKECPSNYASKGVCAPQIETLSWERETDRCLNRLVPELATGLAAAGPVMVALLTAPTEDSKQHVTEDSGEYVLS
ncbi:hypothetical protein K456DRAFT_29364 [Colletotrichum gloeosporioides 23]|nr:hypothetical protein K456DRAFT_29364 [Colletotrichum gloeosporioides 23]